MGWRRFLQRSRLDTEWAGELEAYLLEEIHDNIARGMSPAEARRRAHLKLGNTTLIREEIYQMNSLQWLETAWQDLRYGARLLRKNPTFTLVAVLTLALGTGANAAMFQLLNAVAFQSLPVERPHELASIDVDRHGKGRVGLGYRRGILTQPLWDALRHQQQVFSAMIAWGTDTWDLSTEGEFTPAQGLYVSGSYFEGLRLQPPVGRLLTEADDQKGCGTPGAVLSHEFWTSRYGGDPGAVGRTLTLNRKTFEIVGVAPAGFSGLEVGRSFDVAVPLCAEALLRGQRAASTRPHGWWLDVMGRLKPGTSLEQAQAHLGTLSRSIFEASVPPGYTPEQAQDFRQFTLTAAAASNGVSVLRTQYATHLWLLLGATGLVLLIACANLASLMVARASARQREIAVRLAIGASRSRVVRQLLAESVLIAAVASVAGLLLANWLSRTLVSLLAGEGTSIALNLEPDWRVVVFLLVVAAVACVLFGVGPALRATRSDPGAQLQGGGRSSTEGRDALGFRRGLVVVQVALSMVLVVAALLFTRSLGNLTSVELGFSPDLIAVNVDLGRSTLPPEARRQAITDLVQRVRNVPGVQNASEVFIVPLSGPEWNGRIQVDGVAQAPTVYFNAVGDEYFRTTGTSVMIGRSFGPGDRAEGPRVAIVSETFARQIFGTREALGRRFAMEVPPGQTAPAFEVVGVAADTKYDDVREEPRAIAYLSMSQEEQASPLVSLVVRTDLPLGSIAQALTHEVTAIAPGAAVSYDPVREYLAALLRTDRLMTTLAGLFGGLALVIAVVGLYGVMSYMVTRRRVEIGIRMALGAQPGRIIRMMLLESGVLVGLGGLTGIVLAGIGTRYAAQLLYGVDPLDAVSFGIAAAALASVGFIASWLPARRASLVAPTVVLRD